MAKTAKEPKMQSSAIKRTPGDWVFTIVNDFILVFLAITCLIPFIHLFALTFSSALAADQGLVGLWPVDVKGNLFFSTNAIKNAVSGAQFVPSFFRSIERTLIGTIWGVGMQIISSYPLSKRNAQMPGRPIITWYYIATMLLSGGLIPTYLVMGWTGIIDTVWALTIPGVVGVWSLMVMLNFFRTLPQGLEESAFIDGASQWQILWKIFVPLSKPIIATMIVMSVVGGWNAWFDGMLYLNTSKKWPLMTYLQTVITKPDYAGMSVDQLKEATAISSKSNQAAQILITTVPVLIIYPICQKDFVKGMTLGSLKG